MLKRYIIAAERFVHYCTLQAEDFESVDTSVANVWRGSAAQVEEAIEALRQPTARYATKRTSRRPARSTAWRVVREAASRVRFVLALEN